MLPAISSGNLASIFALSVPHHSREKRQGRQNQFRNNYDQDDDDWYVFDVVEEAPNEKKNQERFSPNNNVQFGTQPPRPRPSRPPAPTTPFIPAFPNAGPPKLPRCEEDCNRQTATSQYNPVCGTNSVTYVNLGRLNCAALCGTGPYKFFYSVHECSNI